jgi:hypothetical protein
VFLLFDAHPVGFLFRQDAVTYVASNVDYFTYGQASRGWPADYVGDIGIPTEAQGEKFERLWPLSVVVQAVIDAGLVIERFDEHAEAFWTAFPRLEDRLRNRIPLTFSLVARRSRAGDAGAAG